MQKLPPVSAILLQKFNVAMNLQSFSVVLVGNKKFNVAIGLFPKLKILFIKTPNKNPAVGN